MAGDRHAQLLAMLDALGPGQPPLEQVCGAAPTLLGVSGVMLTLMAHEEAGTVIARGGWGVEGLEELQFALGEGPCLAAFQEGTTILEPDLLSTGSIRWPVFAVEALALGVRALFAFPLCLGAIRLGVMCGFRDRPGMLTGHQLSDGSLLAEIATLMLIESQSGAATGSAPAVAPGWAHRAVIHQATGMISAQLDAPLSEALARLRAYSFAQDISLYDGAVDVVARRLRFGVQGC